MSLNERRELHIRKVDGQVNEMKQGINEIVKLYESHKEQFMNIKVTNPDDPRLATLNILINSLAIAINDQTQAARKLRGTRRNFC